MSYPGDQSTPGSDPHLPPLLSFLFWKGIFCSAIRVLIYRAKIQTMIQANHRSSSRRATFVRAGLCLFVVLILLYNPFFAIYGSTVAPQVRHPFSYRGTVASSELRCCTISANKLSMEAPVELAVEIILTTRVVQSFSPVFENEPLALSQQIFSAGFFFRPPPAL